MSITGASDNALVTTTSSGRVMRSINISRMFSSSPSGKTQFSPISRLPIDILYYIFQAFDGFSTTDSKDEVRRYLITLTHVCRTWRDVAIYAQSLWTYIDTSKHEEMVAAHLERSGNAKFAVFHCGLDPTGISSLKMALLDLERIHTLSISDIVSLDNVGIKDYLSSPAPELRNLTLITRDKVYEHPLFEGHAPKLEGLTLTCCLDMHMLHTPIIRGLRILKLNFIDTDLTRKRLMEFLLPILEQNSNLQELCLSCDVRDEYSEEAMNLKEPVCMSSLEKLRIHGFELHFVREVMTHMLLAPNVIFDIICWGFPPIAAVMSIYDVIMPVGFHVFSDRKCSHWDMTLHESYALIESCSGEVKEHTQEDDFCLHSSLKLCWSGLDFGEDSDTPDANDIMEAVSSLLRHSFWQEATIACIKLASPIFMGSAIKRDTWKMLLCPLLNVRYLRIAFLDEEEKYIKFDPYESFLRALSTVFPFDDGPVDIRELCYLPFLCHLVLVGFDCDLGLNALTDALSERVSHCDLFKMGCLTIENGFGTKLKERIKESLLQKGYTESISFGEDDVEGVPYKA